MALLILFFLNMASVSFYYDLRDHINIEIELYQTEECMLKEHRLCGEIVFHNQSSQTLKLPKTFDLEIVLTDEAGAIIHRNPDIIIEYHNLIIKNKRMSIKPNDKCKFEFDEWRLFLFNLEEGKRYGLKYVFKPINYPDLKAFCSEKEIETNTVVFNYKRYSY